jgi:hypothetical protein
MTWPASTWPSRINCRYAARHAARFVERARFLGVVARYRERIAPASRARGGGALLGRRIGQLQHAPRCSARALGAVTHETVVLPIRHSLPEHRIDRIDHCAGIAPRVVARKVVSTQAFDDEALGGAEHARLGAAEAVDALLGVADDEHRRGLLPARAAAGAGVRAEPALQRLPLQIAGVLELVDQHMAQPRIEPLLHPARCSAVAQQCERAALEVLHVHPGAIALQRMPAADQRAAQTHHSPMVIVGILLRHLALELQHGIERRRHRWCLGKLARRALFREQRVARGSQRGRGVVEVERDGQFCTGIAPLLVRTARQGVDRASEQPAQRHVGSEALQRMDEAGARRPMLGRRDHRILQRAVRSRRTRSRAACRSRHAAIGRGASDRDVR